MRIYLILTIFLFLTLYSTSAQSVRLHDNKISVTNISLKGATISTLTLTVLIEGRYNGSIMVPDTVTVELRDATIISSVIESQTGVLDTDGVGTISFTNAVDGIGYFILVKYKNAIETWSATPQTFTGNLLNYDFTNSVSKAYGDNLKLKGVKYCIYSGDVNQDGIVDSSDLAAVANDNASGLFGPGLITDLTGDGIVDSDDLALVANNKAAGIYSLVPVDVVPSTVDYGGQTYHTVLIGTHYWLKENMNVGTMINGDSPPTDNEIIEKYCFDNDTANCSLYGGLYQWDEAMQYVTTARTKGICPIDWHVPTIYELNSLITAVDSNGNALKEIGQGTGDGIGTNTSGFSALLSGYFISGYFFDFEYSTDYWSSTFYDEGSANYMYLLSYNNSISQTYIGKELGYSVRCVHD
jgi:uncharacterized protein (TIGR02145 family)